MNRLRPMLFASLLSALAADMLFWKAPIGWTWGAMLLALTLAAGWFHRRAFARSTGRLAFGLALAAEVALVLEPGWLGTLLALVGLAVFTQSDRPISGSGPEAWLLRCLGVSWRLPIKCLVDLFRVRRASRWHHKRGGRTGISLWRFFVRWFLPVAGTLVFACLFAWASPIWEEWLKSGWEQVVRALSFKFPQWLTFGRIWLWVLAAVLAWGFWRVRVKLRPGSAGVQAPVRAYGADLVIRCLSMFTLLFAVQLALDSRYLVLGAELPQGMNHATYAHRGAYPLVFTALLAGLFTLWAFHQRSQARTSPWARRLIVVFIVENILLLVTAAWRLFIYMDAFGLTRWRLAASVWMLLVGGGLALILAQIFLNRDTLWLRWKITAMALPVFVFCAFFPVDRTIGWWNAAHPQTLAFDVNYMEDLGVESIPGLRQAEGVLLEKGDMGTLAQVKEARQRLENRLHELRQDARGWTPRRALIDLPKDFVPHQVPPRRNDGDLLYSQRGRRY